MTLATLLALPDTGGAVLSGANGRIVFLSGRASADGDDSQAKIYLRTILSGTGGGAAGPAITPAAGQHRHPTWSPDRTKIAYSRGTPGTLTTENFDIYIHNLVTGTVTAMTNPLDGVSSDRPAWSPDGTRIAFENEVGNNTGQRDILVRTLASGVTFNLTNSAAVLDSKPAWSPDSQTIYYAAGDPNSNSNILRRPATGGTATLAVPDSSISEFQPSISPDGTKICFTLGTGFNGTTDVYAAPLATPASQTSISHNVGSLAQHGDYNCTWSPDGTKIAYATGTFTTGALVQENSDGSGFLIVLEDDPGNFDGNPDWAPDATPTCSKVSVETLVRAPVTIPLKCVDHGPAYERTPVTESIRSDPTNGTLGPVQQGSPAKVVYTPNTNFTGSDSFEFGGFDARSSSPRVTATIRVLRRGNCANLRNGTGSAETLAGTAFGDRLRGRGGSDRLLGKAGNDCLEGGNGNDRLTGGLGNDRLNGGAGNDVLKGQQGRNTYAAGAGNDQISARNNRRETVNCGTGSDRASVDFNDVVIACEVVTRG